MNNINIINFNEPKDIQGLNLMLEKGQFPALFRFKVESPDLLIKYGNHYIETLDDNNNSLWLLFPKEPMDPSYTVLYGESDISKVVSTESDPNLNSDITLIFKEKPPVNLKSFQMRFKQEVLNDGVGIQR